MNTTDQIKQVGDAAIAGIEEVVRQEIEALVHLSPSTPTDTVQPTNTVQPTDEVANAVEQDESDEDSKDLEEEEAEYFLVVHKYEYGRLNKKERRFVGTLSKAVEAAKAFQAELAASGYKIINKFGESIDISKILEQVGDYA
jgi:hypothetical protein